MSTIRANLMIAALTATLTAAPGTSAQPYPSRPIRMVVPFPAGGASDTFARPIAQKLSETLGQPVIVDNRAGAGGVIGSDAVARAKPDGYTVLVTFASHHLLGFFSKGLPFDAVKDFTAIVAGAMTPFCVVVHPSVAATNGREFIEYVRRNPGKVSYATPGTGSIPHLAGELMNLSAKIDLVHVPYKGGNPAIADLLSGQIPMGIFVLSTVLPHVRAGKLRAVGVVEARRAKSSPDIATMAEGGAPGFPLPDSWIGMLGPAGLPAPIVVQLNAEINKAIETADVRARLEGAGFEVTGGTPEQLAISIARNVVIYRNIVTAAGIRPE